MPTKHVLRFIESVSPVTDPVTKFGGQPVWIAKPEWPLSRQTGKPMQFICQIALGDLQLKSPARMAYLFMTDCDDGEFVDGTYEPDGGENAIILQPGTNETPSSDTDNGPTLYRMVRKPDKERLQPEACEFRVELLPEEDIEFVAEADRLNRSDEDAETVTGKLDENKIGGTPVFMQGEEFPFEDGWQMLLQLDSCNVPFYVNFGDGGVGYAFLNKTGDKAKFLWQCG